MTVDHKLGNNPIPEHMPSTCQALYILTPSHSREIKLQLAHMILAQTQIAEIKSTLEAVTNDFFKQEIAENTNDTFLCAWRSDTHVDYLIHIMRRSYDAYQVCLARQNYKTIETRYDHRLSRVEMDRLINDPRQCVRYWVGQLYDTGYLPY